MADNEGPYVSVGKFVAQLADAGLGESAKIALSAKAVVSGTVYSYTWAGATGVTVQIGDIVHKGDLHAVVVATPSPTVLHLDDGTDIPDGVIRRVRTDLMVEEIEANIAEAMSFIDRHTRQWFNKRTFDGSNPVKIEGNNGRTIFLGVPVISVDKLCLNREDNVLDASDYRVFNSRAMPDDRRNPMIKLIEDVDDVLFMGSGHFMRGCLTYIEGSFGYLEPDGSTPPMIQRATLKLALMYALKSVGTDAEDAANNADVGPVKREKTDFHEIEYYDANAAAKNGGNAGTGLSGDDEVDDIIAAFKSPPIVDGTYPDFGVEAPRLSGIVEGDGGG